MYALPPRLRDTDGEQLTGLSCPDCFGILTVTAEGRAATLRFTCRIGHAYTTDEVIIGKEKRIETLLWAATTAIEELTALLEDLVATGRASGREDSYRARVEHAHRQLELLSNSLEHNDPTALGPDPEPSTGTE